MKLPRLALLAAAPFALLAVACGDDDDDDPTPTQEATTAVASATTPAATETTPPATATTPSTPTDGTVAPQNPGSTEPVTTKPVPDPLTGTPLLQDVRMGVHPENGGWERIVWEFDSGVPPATIEYVDSAQQCGSGNPVEVEGEATLSVQFEGAAAHENGETTFGEQQLEGPGNTILEAQQTCDFEAVLTWVMGIAGEQNFKVMTLQDPPRLVVDVKQ